MGRTLLSLAAVFLGAAVLAGGASGALFLTFSTTKAAPGTVVTARTGGRGALAKIPKGSAPLRVFLAPADDAAGISSPDDGRLTALGRLRVDPQGDGSLRFTVPDVPPGRYTTITHCVPCAAFSGGAEMAPTGPFSGSFTVTRRSDDGFPLLPVLLGAAAAFVGVGAVGWRGRKRRSGRAF